MARLSRVITARLSLEEYEEIRSRAAFRGVTASALLRELLVSHTTESDSPSHLVLGEVLAMRTIMINLLHLIGTHSVLTVDAVSEIIRQADRQKATRADARLKQKGKVDAEDSE
ncbi:MAG: hypothetical protein ABR905_10610 [Terracidiphilus sp.]|jgi:hypothetical protein